ncbi:MAG: bifunctional oligoribonuclease/PAP phosphatase NrnA [Treponema sp.]|nr:bifunctional oligoribonuclease/PAP phosphatase NrnA [Treponema sp.]
MAGVFQPVPEELLGFIREGGKFIVAGHREPDGDCVGSQLALASVLRRLGKEAIPCSAGPFKRTEIKPYERLFASTLTAEQRAGARVLIVDCSAADRTGDLRPFLEGLPAAVIDHHDSVISSGWHGVQSAYLDTNALSTTFMVLKVISALGVQPLPEEAQFLFFGLCTDTGFFRHVDGNGAEVFEAAAALVHSGANPKSVFAAMYGGKSLDSRKLMGHILLRAKPFFDGKLILSFETFEETSVFGLEGRDSDTLYQLLQAVAGVEAIVIIRQESPGNCTVGFRSRDLIDVGSIARSFGGGGHKNAAGLYIAGTIEELSPKIVKAFESVFMPA